MIFGVVDNDIGTILIKYKNITETAMISFQFMIL